MGQEKGVKVAWTGADLGMATLGTRRGLVHGPLGDTTAPVTDRRRLDQQSVTTLARPVRFRVVSRPMRPPPPLPTLRMRRYVAEQDVAEPVFVVDYGTVDPGSFAANRGADGRGRFTASGAWPSTRPRFPGRYRTVDAAPGVLPDEGAGWRTHGKGVDPVPGTAAVQTADTMMGGAGGGGRRSRWATPTSTARPSRSRRQSDGELRGRRRWRCFPTTTTTRPTTACVYVPPPTKVVVGGWMIVVGALALMVGSTMTWMTVRGPCVNDSATATGMSIGDGRITVVLAIALVVLGAGLLTGRLRKLGGTKVAAMGALVAGAAGVAVTAIDIADVADRATRPRRAARRGDECRERAVALLPRRVARGGRRAHGVREP